MKNWLKRVPKETLQRYVFFSMLGLLFIVFIIAMSVTETPVEDPEDLVDDPEPVAITEKFALPYQGENFKVVFTYFDVSKESAENVNAYERISDRATINSIGVAYALNTDQEFQVVSTLSGTVSSVEMDDLYGYVVQITHDDEFISEYRCLSEALVEEGDTVKQYDVIGLSGNSQLKVDAQSYVYFIVYEKNKPCNPLNLFDKTTEEVMTETE